MSNMDWKSLHESLERMNQNNDKKFILKNRFVNQKKFNKNKKK